LLFSVGDFTLTQKQHRKNEVLHMNMVIEENIMVPMRDGVKLATCVGYLDYPSKIRSFLEYDLSQLFYFSLADDAV
jgi:hypothetical protein